MATVLFGVTQAALETQRVAAWQAWGLSGSIGGWPVAAFTSLGHFAAVAALGVIVARARPRLWWVPAAVLAFGPMLLAGDPLSPLGGGWAHYGGRGWVTSRSSAAWLDWTMAALPAFLARSAVAVRRRPPFDVAAAAAAALVLFTVIVAVYALALTSAVPHPPWAYLPAALVVLGAAWMTHRRPERIAVAAAAVLLSVPGLVPHLGLYITTGTRYWGPDGSQAFIEPLSAMAVAFGVGWAGRKLVPVLRVAGGPLGWPVALNLANLADAAMTAWFVGRGVATEANPIVAMVGLPGKVIAVGLVSLLVAWLRPGALRWPTLVLIGVLVWHAGGLLTAE